LLVHARPPPGVAHPARSSHVRCKLEDVSASDAIETVANGYELNCDVGAVSSAQK
jgi:hypothetical protein